MKAQFPRKLRILWTPSRYKILVGGRGGGKSWGIARALLLQGAQRKLRILCAREVQNSIAESVHALLCDQLADLGLAGFYRPTEKCIFGANGTEFIFRGLRALNVVTMKSLEGVDICWCEEAQTISKKSWEILIPTIRKEDSEIWVGFNPDVSTDDTYKRFILNSPPGSIVQWLRYSDNPWFPETLEIERKHLQSTDPVAYMNVWEGEAKSEVAGAIYGPELKKAREEGRICQVSIDRSKPIHTFWDLGFGDENAIWFAQSLPGGQYRIVDYEHGSGLTIADYCVKLQERKYMYGVHWLPHDGVDAMIHKQLTGNPLKSPEMLLRAAGYTCHVVPKLSINTGINAVRTIFPQCWFDAEKCADGLQALAHYQWTPDTASGVQSREPLHNFASHASDALRTLALAIKTPMEAPQKPRQPEPAYSWQA